MNREAEGWLRLHPLTPVLNLFRGAYAVVIVLAVAGPAVGADLGAGFLALAAIAAGISFLAYIRFRYSRSSDSLIITEGILFRRRRMIPRSRIQHIDLKAGPVHRILGVVEARIETAGGESTEAALRYVSRAEGWRLRDQLVTGAGGPATAPPEAFSGDPESLERADAPESAPSFERRVGLLDLAIAGATSNRAGVLVGLLFGGDAAFGFIPTDWLLQLVLPAEYLETEVALRALVDTARGDFRAFLIGTTLLGTLFVVIGWGLSILLSVARYFDFSIRSSSGELRVGYGLLTRRETGFRVSRIQNVQIEESILRRWLGLGAMRVQTAGYAVNVNAEEKMEVLTPIARVGELASYARSVFADLDLESVPWRRSHPRALRRMFFRRAAIIVLAALAAWPFLASYALLVLVALIPAWVMARLHYRHLGHARQGDYVLTREGFWNRRTYIVPVRKIQALHLRQTPFQRRLELGTLTLETAGSSYEWHSPRSVDVGRAYGLELMGELAGAVRATGLTF